MVLPWYYLWYYPGITYGITYGITLVLPMVLPMVLPTVYLKIGTMHYLLTMEDFRKTGEDTHELGDYANLHVINHSNRINCYKEKLKFSAD
jgi:hypothetical protein